MDMPVELIDTVTGERTNLDPEKYFVQRQELSWENQSFIDVKKLWIITRRKTNGKRIILFTMSSNRC